MSAELRDLLVRTARRETAPGGSLARTLARAAAHSAPPSTPPPPSHARVVRAPVESAATNPAPLAAEAAVATSSLVPWVVGVTLALAAATTAVTAGVAIARRAPRQEEVVASPRARGGERTLPPVVAHPVLSASAPHESALRRTRAGAAAPVCGTLGEEALMLRRARQLERAGEIDAASRAVHAYLARCPSGQMVEEAQVFRVELLVRAGDCNRARSALSHVKRHYARSQAVRRVAAMLDARCSAP